MRSSGYVCCLWLLASVSAIGALSPILEIDAVRNGGFEESGAEGSPAGWGTRRDLPDGARLSWCTERPHSGTRGIAIESTHAADRPWFWWEQRIGLRGRGAYRLTAWVRSKSLARGAVLILACRDAGRKQLSRRSLGQIPRDRPEWTKVEVAFRAPPGTVSGNIQLSMHGKGSVWLDDLRIVEHMEPKVVPVADAKHYPVTKPTGPISIDGSGDEWQGTPRAVVRHAYTVSQAEAIVMDKEDSRGSGDLSFDFALRHDDLSLYLLVNVRDDVRRTAKPYWQGDSVQLAIDTTYGRREQGHGPGDYAVGVVPRATGCAVVVERRPDGSTLSASNIAVASTFTEGGYTVEMAIPWAALDVKPPRHNDRMGFCIIVNDSDGKGRKWAEWTPGIAKGKRPSEYGTLVFFDREQIGLSLQAHRGEVTDMRPLALRATILSLVQRTERIRATLAVDSGGDGMTDARELSISPGVNHLPLVYEAGSVVAGAHTARLSLGDVASTVSFQVAPLRAMVEDVRARMTRIRSKMAELTRLVHRGTAAKLDMALPDATLATAEHFARWIPADVAREGHEALALLEARRLEPRLDAAISEAKHIVRHPADRPAVSPPNALEAVLRGANWYVGDRPVFLIGFNGFDKSHLTDLPRLGCNFDTSGGGAAAYLLAGGPEPDLEAIRRSSVESIRKAAALGIRSNIHFGHRLPRWAIEKHPDLTAAEGHFMFYDLDHPEARRLTCAMMEAVARAIKELPGVTCYDLWNEAAYTRMSPRGLRKFREAMRGKYGTVAKLNAAWGAHHAGFDMVKPVVRDPARPAAYSDWVRWNNSRFTEYVAEMRAAVRRGDPHALTTVKLSNEAAIVGTLNHAYRRQRTSRHNMGVDRWALAQLLEIQGCDTRPTLLSPDYAFAWRYPGMAYDLQRSMAPGKPIDDSEWHGVQTVYHEDRDQPAEFINAALWFSYLHGMDMNLTWWWSRKGTEPKTQWFAGSLTTQPQLLDAWVRNSIVVQRFAAEVVAFQETPARVRILFSKPSAILDLEYLDTQRDAYESLHWVGLPIGFVTEEMLLTGFNALDLLVIPAARHASPGVREAVAKLAAAGVTVVVVGEDCLSLDPHGRSHANAVRLGTQQISSGKDLQALAQALEVSGITRQARCIGPDGSSAKPVEFRATQQGGRLLGYLIGLGKGPVKIVIERNGQPARWRSLLTGMRHERSIDVGPHDFDLFAFE